MPLSDLAESSYNSYADYTQPGANDGALGCPRAKPRVGLINLFVVVTSFGLLPLACVVVNPASKVAWYLALKHQLTATGLLVALQAICLQRLYGKTFPLIEAYYGGSRLQNYEAILTNSDMTVNTSVIWCTVTFLCLALPFRLSTAYKQFTEGASHNTVQSDGHAYGQTRPARLNVGYLYGLNVMSNITTPFIDATSNNTGAEHLLKQVPHAFSFNMLLLSKFSAAFLDALTPDVVAGLQSNLEETETYSLSARVYGLVASHNTSLDELRFSDSFWNTSYFPTTDGVRVADLYTHNKLALYAWYLQTNGEGVEDHTWCMLSV